MRISIVVSGERKTGERRREFRQMLYFDCSIGVIRGKYSSIGALVLE